MAHLYSGFCKNLEATIPFIDGAILSGLFTPSEIGSESERDQS